MRWLIRRVLKKGKGSISYEDDIHFGEILTIGRAADQAIFLPDLRAALNHASVTALGNGQYRVESLIVAGIRVNGELTYTKAVGTGAVIELGSTRLTLLDARGEFDAAVEVSTIDKSEQAAIRSSRSKPTSLDQTWIAKRWPSWTGFILVLALGLILPASTHVIPWLQHRIALFAATQHLVLESRRSRRRTSVLRHRLQAMPSARLPHGA
jgi:hypothetical protein